MLLDGDRVGDVDLDGYMGAQYPSDAGMDLTAPLGRDAVEQ